MNRKVLLLFLLYAFVEVQSAKILAVFPFPSISHQVVFRTITNKLIEKGHEVTVITPDPAYPKGEAPTNLKEIDVHDISYSAVQKYFQENYNAKQKKISKFTEIRQGSAFLAELTKIQFQSSEVQELIANQTNKFDLLLIEQVMRPALAYSHIFKAPVIVISSFGAIFNSHDILGSLTHPLLYPTPIQRKIYNLTNFEKLKEVYTHYLLEFANYLNEGDENFMIQQIIGGDVPPLKELYNNIHMLFINVHPIWADNQPVPPGVVYMGGIHQLPKKELPKDLKTYLDSSEHGVIYVSFGTNVLSDLIPSEKVQTMINVFRKLPYDVLWKWDKDELTGKSSNIKISKWLPQSDLLRHPKIKLFVTQAGLQSTDESITAGVPLVSIPMLGDQWYNAEKYVKHGIGIKLDIETLTEQEFKSAIETVIDNKSYRKNVAKLRKIMLDQPEPPLQRAIWWIEHVIRHQGAKHLRAPTANISFIEYLELELVTIVVLSVLISLTLLVLSFVVIFRYILNLLNIKKKIKNN